MKYYENSFCISVTIVPRFAVAVKVTIARACVALEVIFSSFFVRN